MALDGVLGEKKNKKKQKTEHFSTGSGLLLVLRPGEVLANTRLINALYNYNVASLEAYHWTIVDDDLQDSCMGFLQWVERAEVSYCKGPFCLRRVKHPTNLP